MGVAVASGSRARPGCAYGLPAGAAAVRRRGVPAHAGPWLVPAAPWRPRGQRKAFWALMNDDRELIPLKALLLGSLVLLAAVLEWVA